VAEQVGSGVGRGGRPAAGRARRRSPTVELRCRTCGYGAIVRGVPPACPMCQGSEWDDLGWRPFSAQPTLEGVLMSVVRDRLEAKRGQGESSRQGQLLREVNENIATLAERGGPRASRRRR
jgi:hypothetical protein